MLVDGKCSFTFAARYAPDPTLEVGDHTVLSHDCSFAVGRRITIGRHCLIANGVWMADTNGHPTDPADRLAGLPAPAEKVRPITIGDNVWIGSRSLILPGTTIGEGSVVSAMSVVRGEIPPYTLVAGNPARPVCSLKEIRSPSIAGLARRRTAAEVGMRSAWFTVKHGEVPAWFTVNQRPSKAVFTLKRP